MCLLINHSCDAPSDTKTPVCWCWTTRNTFNLLSRLITRQAAAAGLAAEAIKYRSSLSEDDSIRLRTAELNERDEDKRLARKARRTIAISLPLSKWFSAVFAEFVQRFDFLWTFAIIQLNRRVSLDPTTLIRSSSSFSFQSFFFH